MTVASRDPGGAQRMKNERCTEFWWDEGTGSVITKVVTTCALPLDYKRERSVWGVWLHVPAEAIRGSTCRMASFTLIWSGVCADEQTKCESSWSLGGALEERQMIWISAPQSLEVVTVSQLCRECRHWLCVAARQQNITKHVWVSQRNPMRAGVKTNSRLAALDAPHPN